MERSGRVIFYFLALMLIVSGFLLSACDDDEGNECALDDETLCIGVILPEDDPSVAGASLAESDINNAGGNIKIIYRDSREDPEVGFLAAEELLDLGIEGVLGAASSSVSGRILTKVHSSRVVMVSPSATAPAFTALNEFILSDPFALQKTFFHRTAPSDVFIVPFMIERIKTDTGATESNKAQIALIYRDDRWGESLSQGVEFSIENNPNLTLIKTVKYPEITSENPITNIQVRTIVNDLKDSATGDIGEADVIILFAFTEGANILRAMLEDDGIPNPTSATGTASLGVPGLARYYTGDGFVPLDIGERLVEVESILSPPPPSFNKDLTNGIIAIASAPDKCKEGDFNRRLQNEIVGLTSFAFSHHSYDALVLMALASLAAKSDDPEVYVDYMKPVSEVGETCESYRECADLLTDGDENNNDINYEGVSGPIDFNDVKDITKGFYAVYEYDTTVAGSRTETVYNLDGTPTGDCT